MGYVSFPEGTPFWGWSYYLSVNFLHRILEKAAEALCLEKDFASAAEKVLTGSPLVVTGWLMVMLRTRCAPALVRRPYKCPTYSWFWGPLCMWRRTVFSLSCLATLRYFEGIWNQHPKQTPDIFSQKRPQNSGLEGERNCGISDYSFLGRCDLWPTFL